MSLPYIDAYIVELIISKVENLIFAAEDEFEDEPQHWHLFGIGKTF